MYVYTKIVFEKMQTSEEVESVEITGIGKILVMTWVQDKKLNERNVKKIGNVTNVIKREY